MNLMEGVLFMLLTFIAFGLCVPIDTLSPGHYLKGGDVLVSSRENFVLGFFSPANSSRRYLGIWFNKISEQTIVWVANRNNPLNNNAGILTVTDEGKLVLFEDGNQTIPVWSTSIPASSRNSTAQLLDTGNLVLLQQGSNEYLWQSFDYPTNVFLPYMKFGVDLRTGLDRFLTSWKSIDDPGTGDFSHKMDIRGHPHMMLHKGPVTKWRSGPWTGLRWSGTPEMTNIISIHPFVNEEEISVYYTMTDASVLCKLMLTETGNVHWSTWNGNENRWIRIWSSPQEDCNNDVKCGPNSNCDPFEIDNFMCKCLPGFEPKSPHNWYLRDGSEGCIRKVGAFTCQNGEGFVKVTKVKLPDASAARVDMGMSFRQCEQECLKDCSCIAFTSTSSSKDALCFRWSGDLLGTRKFFGATQDDIYVRVNAVEKALYMETSNGLLAKKGVIALTATSIATVLLITISTLYWLIQRKNSSKDFIEEIEESKNPNLPLFGISTIKTATDWFSIANKLGEGGFGPVYKGRLENGEEIAVKKLAKSSRQGTKEFKNEARLISKLQHKNVVRFVGCCIHKDERMLIYEFMPNKSLDCFIFDKTGKMLLDWKKRLEIINGIARGLSYLHHESRLKIIHRDLKASNVLLDAAMNPKISDFGTAKTFREDQSEAKTRTVVGTYGYMSPEYAMRGMCSIKSDVFSFGVLTLEIVSGKRNNAYYKESPSTNMIGLAWELWKEGKAMGIVDTSLQYSYMVLEVLRCIQIGLLCVQESAADRPTMLEVLSMLGNDNTLASPKKPAYTFRGNPNSLTAGKCSTNSITLTIMEPR